MRILVIPHQMSMGGSQINAIELAAKVRDMGHHVVLYAPHGVLDPLVDEVGVPRIVKRTDADLSPGSVRRLVDIVRRERIDLIHAYEWGPSLEATFGPHLRFGVPVLMTVLSMVVDDFLPRHLPMTLSTREMVDQRRAVHERVLLTEPPIDTDLNTAGDRAAARAVFGFEDDEIVVTTVCRLTSDLEKLEGTLVALDVLGRLAHDRRVTMVIVGDGTGLDEVRRRADIVNADHGRTVIHVTGQLLDPRPAYDAADVMIGMGSSALKGLAFGKPLVVQGEGGYWKLLTPDTVDEFLYAGWFGRGGRGAADFEPEIVRVLDDRALRTELGVYGLELARRRYSLTVLASALESMYEDVLSSAPGREPRALARSAREVAKFLAYRVVHPSPVASSADGRTA
ncbi:MULTISPECIES: glycosyltransferase [unclassified Rhodococcus (in: high G+C Gram-positive bacteria)]|uniref:glycosyltransferase n=1 Tax=unclassified Rhodococcus (in: high G+C Gram-positive bacteria) TaxID=192944 RepID=UPI002E27E9F0|nr:MULTISPECIES: glycosyltransferase [unclassified Rhodococcus (in: high G+C Gram-positive bacteria)]